MVKRKKTKRRRAPAVLSTPAPLLSLCMMVKDEEALLEAALLSVRDWVDEMVVVDTGSTDRTVEIARDLGATLHFYAWPNSFAQARNETLRRATGQWCLVLDADERVRGAHPERVRDLLVPTAQHPFDVYMLRVLNMTRAGAPLSDFFSVRIFPNDRRLGYSGRVHNRFGVMEPGTASLNATRVSGLHIAHLGYDPALYEARNKTERSLPLIELSVQEAPDDLRMRFYLGREYLQAGRPAEGIPHLERAVEGLLSAPGRRPLPEAADTLMRAYLADGARHSDMLAVGARVLGRFDDEPDIWYGVGQAALSLGDARMAATALEKTLEHVDADRDGLVRTRHLKWQVQQLLGHARWDLQDFPGAYAAFTAALVDKPADSAGWPQLLHHLCALAIELGHAGALPALLERLVRHPAAPLGMLFFEVERRRGQLGPAAARALLEQAVAWDPRVRDDAEYGAVAARL
jgi:tetratricopeptide (TPR) repeat protein